MTWRALGLLMAIPVLLAACSSGAAQARPAPLASRSAEVRTGKASWYGKRFDGRKTASGERFDAGKLTAAHRTLPFGTWVRVTNLANDRTVVVRINDRGPWSKRRVLDLSEAAARKLGMIRAGVARVKFEVVDRAPPTHAPQRGPRRQR
jgi:rare lipoprotein A